MINIFGCEIHNIWASILRTVRKLYNLILSFKACAKLEVCLIKYSNVEALVFCITQKLVYETTF